MQSNISDKIGGVTDAKKKIGKYVHTPMYAHDVYMMGELWVRGIGKKTARLKKHRYNIWF